MGCQAIIHGRIVVGDHAKAVRVIKSFEGDKHYPWFRPAMFSLGETETPYYYDEPVLAFAATYKYGEWEEYVIKLECLLAQLDFVSAKMEVETEFMGHFNFFWLSNTDSISEATEQKMIVTPRWFFGFGLRDMLGNPIADVGYLETLPDVAYPMVIQEEIRTVLNNFVEATQQIPRGQRIFLSDYMKSDFTHFHRRVMSILLLRNHSPTKFSENHLK